MRSIIISLSALAVFLLFSEGFSQDKPHEVVYSKAEVISQPEMDPAVSEVVRNINHARIMGDNNAMIYWQEKLNELTMPQIIQQNDSVDLFGNPLNK